MRLDLILKRTPFLWRYADRFSWRGSRTYWEERYADGGNSGLGSYGHLATYKAEVLNEFVRLRRIESVIEFGCGDGNQLSLADYPNYIGLDVSTTAIEKCKARFQADSTKRFLLYGPRTFDRCADHLSGDLVISLDVIYHLVEDRIYHRYMRDLFGVSAKYIIIYSSNHEEVIRNAHVRHRCVTQYVEANCKEWRFTEKIQNRYPIAQYGAAGSFADFYVFERC